MELIEEKDYHVHYLSNTKFEQQMWDVYIGTSAQGKAPFLEDFYSESVQIHALMLLERYKEQPQELSLSDHEWGIAQQSVWSGDEASIATLLFDLSPHDFHSASEDTMRYLTKNRLSFMMKGTYEIPKIVNAPVVEAW